MLHFIVCCDRRLARPETVGARICQTRQVKHTDQGSRDPEDELAFAYILRSEKTIARYRRWFDRSAASFCHQAGDYTREEVRQSAIEEQSRRCEVVRSSLVTSGLTVSWMDSSVVHRCLSLLARSNFATSSLAAWT